MYGSGLRLMECVRLRVKDLDFDHRAILVRDGKGAKDRVVTLADELIPLLRRHLEAVRNLQARTWSMVAVGFLSPMPWNANNRTRQRNGLGSMCFRPGSAASTRDQEWNGGIIWTRAACRKP